MISCVDERGQYTGYMTYQDEDCADWFDLYDQNQANTTLNDILNLDNFPDSSYDMAGNKCRHSTFCSYSFRLKH